MCDCQLLCVEIRLGGRTLGQKRTRSLERGDLSRTRGCFTSKEPAPVRSSLEGSEPFRTTRRLPPFVASVGVLGQEVADLHFDGRLEHFAGSFSDDHVERDLELEGLAKLDNFWIDWFDRSRSRWCPDRLRCNVSHGLSLCLVAAEESLPSAGSAVFLHLKRTRLSTIPGLSAS
jgi:hypothetical protein